MIEAGASVLRRMLGVYGSSKMGVLLLLGFSSGLPLLLINTTLNAWLTQAGLTTIAIGLFNLLNLPYSFKFLWSPVLDRFLLPAPGSLRGSRRRGWMALTQVLLLLSIGLLGFQDPTQTWLEALGWEELSQTWPGITVFTRPIFLVGLLVAFLSASQDIAVDAYRTDILAEREMGAGVAIFVFGYRIALLVSSGVSLILADYLPWWQVYGIMALLMLIGLITSFLAPEPENSALKPTSLRSAIIEPFQSFWRHRLAWAILLFVVCFKLPDSLAGQMTPTFLLQTGFSTSDLGIIRSWIGLLATLAGAFVGGEWVSRIGTYRCLFIFAALQGIGNLGLGAIGLVGQNYPLLLGATIFDNMAGGMGTAAFLAFLMSLCDRQFSATQYALLTSVFAVGGTLAGAVSGYLAAAVNWPLFYLITAMTAAPAMVILLWLGPPSSTAALATAAKGEASEP
ncbi:MFS transporter [Synechococcus sp. W60.1]|jgi:PAT family beta-lactamase induction signal transducer AmpG